MGFFNRDFRCFDNDSIDMAAMMESIWESACSSDSSTDFGSNSDTWSSDSFSSDNTGSWSSSDD